MAIIHAKGIGIKKISKSQLLKKELNSKELSLAFGDKTIKSYLKLKKQELKDFNNKETFSKKSGITDWEKTNTLDC